jgi:hypothetical protein
MYHLKPRCTVKQHLTRLEQSLKACSAATEQRCRCDGNRWLCEEGEEPPACCPTCGGSNPPGLILRYEIVETVETEER